MLRYLFLRFLPRRLMPLLFLLELYRLFRGWQTRNDPVIHRTPMGRTGSAVDGTRGYRADRGA